MSTATSERRYPDVATSELVLGLVYGAGVQVEPIEERMRAAFAEFAYRLELIRLSDSFPQILGRDYTDISPNSTRHLQDMGDDLREKCGNDIGGRLAAFLIATRRRALADQGDRVAWLVRSLRRPEEVRVLRQAYGPRFLLIGIHAPEAMRLRNLTARRRRTSPTTSGQFETAAIEDLKRDHHDVEREHGQSMSRTFPLADFVLDARASDSIDLAVPRMAEVIFGETTVSPTRDEQAMFLAHSAGHRSAEMGRQVGATLVDSHGDVIATGTNEVPAGGGGLYWFPDKPDGRDFAQEVPIDSNTDWKRRVSRELLVRLRKPRPHTSSEPASAPVNDADQHKEPSNPGGSVTDEGNTEPWITTDRIPVIEGEVVVTDTELNRFIQHIAGTRLADLIEFGRAVHAEMEAILSAARRGVATQGATLVCTNSPCHNCMRHLIAAGVCRVIYMIPYTKSLALELHGEAVVFEPEDPQSMPEDKLSLEQFVGVTPRGFAQYFDFSRIDRKDDLTGEARKLENRRETLPRVLRDYDAWSFGGPALNAGYVTTLEQDVTREFLRLLSDKALTVPTTN